ncbi:MAG: hypothetical protein ACRBK7_14485 [Acidimicrobiales bacterium]
MTTSTATPLDRIQAALHALTELGYWASDPDTQRLNGNPSCRCCVTPDRDRYVYAGGGMETGTLHEWIEHGVGHLSWKGDPADIETAFGMAGLATEWDGNPSTCIKVVLTSDQLRELGKVPRCRGCQEHEALCVCEQCMTCGRTLDALDWCGSCGGDDDDEDF